MPGTGCWKQNSEQEKPNSFLCEAYVLKVLGQTEAQRRITEEAFTILGRNEITLEPRVKQGAGVRIVGGTSFQAAG